MQEVTGKMNWGTLNLKLNILDVCVCVRACVRVGVCVACTYIRHHYFTATGAIVRLFQYHWSNPNALSKIEQNVSKTSASRVDYSEKYVMNWDY